MDTTIIDSRGDRSDGNEILNNSVESGKEIATSTEADTVKATVSTTDSVPLCPELLEFYQSHNVLKSASTSQQVLSTLATSNPYRFVRLNPRHDKTKTLHLLQQELEAFHQSKLHDADAAHSIPARTPPPPPPRPVEWIDPGFGFYALPGDFSLSSSPCFRSGRIYGMDISSGASVAALLTTDHDLKSEATMHYKSLSTASTTDEHKEIRVLDLCTCPGLKLLTMADYFYQQQEQQQQHGRRSIKVVGVDVNGNRMEKCKSIVQKYWIDPETSGETARAKASTAMETTTMAPSSTSQINLQLYVADGTTFGASASANSSGDVDNGTLVFDSRVAMEEMRERGKRKRMNKSARARQRKRLQQIASSEATTCTRSRSTNDDSDSDGSNKRRNEDSSSTMAKFDYVLVDAECSTDGSFKHVKERIKESQYSRNDTTAADADSKGYQEENRRLTDRNKLSELVELQKKLIQSGFCLLMSGGSMVYSTCSLSSDQNEKVVAWLLETNDKAFLIPIHFEKVTKSKYVVEGSLKGTIRFYPNLSTQSDTEEWLLGDGFFAAKIGKH